jgi:hypothetical protein
LAVNGEPLNDANDRDDRGTSPHLSEQAAALRVEGPLPCALTRLFNSATTHV